MVASAVLAQSDRLGNAYFLAIGPAVIFLALIGWVTVVLTTSRERHHYPSSGDGLPHRGPVMGGVIMGGPSQRPRRDPVAHGEVAAPVEQGRTEEEARVRGRAEAERVRAEPPARSRRRFGLPRLR
ncbi:hypothetical protein [Actinomadura mexicana]|uniref:Uncharacterized protein n=1 Tax=Actinomadura mexicana TaxID=134959 RepID=A0A239AQ53_9ACTN|nr:hypothetical protein [Actinomadura mexicana]SNR97481.1 hypothetical protein SAMN06265355_109122 [Actinomadura mexicana]